MLHILLIVKIIFGFLNNTNSQIILYYKISVFINCSPKSRIFINLLNKNYKTIEFEHRTS